MNTKLLLIAVFFLSIPSLGDTFELPLVFGNLLVSKEFSTAVETAQRSLPEDYELNINPTLDRGGKVHDHTKKIDGYIYSFSLVLSSHKRNTRCGSWFYGTIDGSINIGTRPKTIEVHFTPSEAELGC